jgi:hypothetical protein
MATTTADHDLDFIESDADNPRRIEAAGWVIDQAPTGNGLGLSLYHPELLPEAELSDLTPRQGIRLAWALIRQSVAVSARRTARRIAHMARAHAFQRNGRSGRGRGAV